MNKFIIIDKFGVILKVKWLEKVNERPNQNHLKKGGIFIFDFWYGPAVLTDLPSTRVKRLKSEEIKVTRIAEPKLHPQLNVVDVNYDIYIQDLISEKITQQKELHRMRYFFDAELKEFILKVGFKIKQKYKYIKRLN